MLRNCTLYSADGPASKLFFVLRLEILNCGCVGSSSRGMLRYSTVRMRQQLSILVFLLFMLHFIFSRIQQQRHVAQLHSAEAPYECSRCHRRFKSDYRQAANIALSFISLTDKDRFQLRKFRGTVPTSVYFRTILLR